MNERIKQLAGQTGIIDVALLNDSQSKMLEKFAELLVKECMGINLTLLGHNTCKNLHNLYEEHFGVEE
jgi:hypothetical protein